MEHETSNATYTMLALLFVVKGTGIVSTKKMANVNMIVNAQQEKLNANGSGLCVVALSRNLKLTTTLDRAITQNPCYVPFLFRI